MQISINEVSNGLALEIDGAIWIIQQYSHVKPGKGSAFVRLKLKNVRTQQVVERTYKTADKLTEVELTERKLQNLYESGDDFYFMDSESFEEVVVSRDIIGDNIKFLLEQLEVKGLALDGEILRIELPIFVECTITHTEPGFRGDTSRSGYKPATIETGATIQVPLFIEIDDKVKIDTRKGEYVERVKK